MKKEAVPNRNLAPAELKSLAAPPGSSTAAPAQRPPRFQKPLHPKRVSTPPNGGPAKPTHEPKPMHEEMLNAEQVLSALVALKQGKFDVRLPGVWTGIAGKVADTFNDVAAMMAAFMNG